MSEQTTRRSRGILVALAGCMALQMTGFVMLLPLFARRFDTFGAGVEALGASAMAYALTSSFAAPLIGILVDRLGRRPIILVSLGAYVLAFSGYLFAACAWQLIVVRGLAGVLTAGLVPAMMSVVRDLAPENRRAQWVGIVNGGASAGWIGGPFLGGFLYDRFDYIVPFTASIMMAIGALFLAIFRIPETSTPALPAGRPRRAWRALWLALPTQPPFLLLMFITFGVMFAWAFIEPQFMFYAYDDLSWASSQLGLVMSAYGVAFMLGEFTLGRLGDRVGRKPVLVLGLALFSVQFIGLAIFRDATWIGASFILSGLGNALYDPALSALILDIAPHDQTARMIGLKSTAGSLGTLIGPALVVVFTPLAGPHVVFLIAAALVSILALVAGLGLCLPETKGHPSLLRSSG